MIEIGSGLAAIIGASVGGLASFAGTWLSSHFELKKVRDEREAARDQAQRDEQIRAAYDLIAAGSLLVALGQRWSVAARKAGRIEDRAIVDEFRSTYASLTDAAGRVAVLGPQQQSGFAALAAAKRLAFGLEAADDEYDDLTSVIEELAHATKGVTASREGPEQRSRRAGGRRMSNQRHNEQEGRCPDER